MARITVFPGEVAFHAAEGTPLRELLIREGLMMDFPCGGKGLCGQCRVTLSPPTASGREGRRSLPAGEVAAGVRLACRTVVEGDCTVTLPEGKSGPLWKDAAHPQETHLLAGRPLVRRLPVRLAPPGLADQRPDWERLAAALAAAGAPVGRPDPRGLEPLSRLLRENGWAADAVLQEDRLLRLLPAGQGRVYGFAIDLGTTTVDIALHDLESGRRTARRVLLNRQAAFGADVISRAQAFASSRGPVREAALQTIREGAWAILKEEGIEPEAVVRSVLVGNPIMVHILHDLDPQQLTLAPYIPLIGGPIERPPAELGFDFQRCGVVETLPLVSAFVGADTTGMILALDLEHDPLSSLNIDIGTNGEMVLAHDGAMIATSTAAGPAFEGAQIACGMRAVPGAVTSLSIGGNGEVTCRTMGDAPARGICGSGLISATAALLEAGILDASGRFREPQEIAHPALRERLVAADGQRAFLIAPESRVWVTQKDIRELQLAKGAIRTGIESLLQETSVALERIGVIRLAGNFGSGLDPREAMRIGLIPAVDPGRVDLVGNAALRGAALALVSKDYRDRARRLPERCRFLELAGKPEFQMRFAEAMLF
jgi:uncharacterized 2Fe-2S/4Fe-4S cluster protein (DUF4445 family)